jgi:D-alanyl-D-alanine carboxypeptidase (penicillin-binding protein 5/6)
MIRIKKYLVFILLILLCLCQALSIVTHGKSTTKAESYSSEIVMDIKTNRVLHENNAYIKKYMASTTKILTAIVIIENCDINEVVTVSKNTVGIEGSSIYLEEGEKLSVKDLLYGLMLRSGNDCAVTLAVHCSKTIDDFALLMNETARRLGANSSNFVNPHGLHDDNHYTTAYDLALISCYAMKNSIFREIVGTKSIQIPHTNRNYNRILVNKNKMLIEFDGSTGIKTGFTKKAGRCLVSSCVRDGMELVCVVLNCPPMFERSKELLKNCFSEFKYYKLFESDHIIDFLPVENSSVKCGIYIKNDVVVPLNKTESESLEIQYDYPKIMHLPIKKDTEIGSIKICCKNNLIFTEKIYTIIEVD